MKSNPIRLISALIIAGFVLIASGCQSDFYLSESEAAAYTNLFANEATANNFLSTSLSGQVLDIQFDNSSSPPTIRSTNLVSLMRNYSTLGLVEAINPQIRPDRLNTELQTQIERYIRNKLQVYTGTSNAGVQLSRLTSVQVTFRNQPTFTFHPERQAIAFDLTVNLSITATIKIDVLDPVTDFLFNVNGSYPLVISANDLRLSGEASLRAPFANASEIAFNLTPQLGSVTVTNSGSSVAPAEVRNGVRALVQHQLSQAMNEHFIQRYSYFALTGLTLTPNTAQTTSELNYTYRALAASASPMMHIVARAADGKLYHLRKTEIGRSVIATVQPFPNLQTRIENEPALFASAADQLEVAATTTAGDLVYAHWRDQTWINQNTFPPASSSSTAGYNGKPALAASAPGQVEIIAPGRNGGLWHLRRLNGRWSNPVPISIGTVTNVRVAPYRDPVAVVTGNKVVVVFVDSTNHLQAIAYDLESSLWGQATQITTQELVGYAPAAAASGDGRVDVVYAGTNGDPHHRILEIQTGRFQANVGQSGISIVGSETNIGGTVNAAPVLLCSSYKQLELIGRGTDNRLYHNHFVGPSSPTGWVDGRWINQGWYGWGDVNGYFAGNLPASDGRMTSFAAAVTRTGTIVSAAIAKPSIVDNNTEQLLYYNTYNSERFGVQPWKTVLWRGYDPAGQQRFVGQPAMAATDRNFALAYIDSNLTAQRARLTESNDTSFVGVENNIQVGFSTPVDPVMVSSVAGQSDAVLVGSDGRLRHIRRGDRVGSSTFVLPAPGNQLIRAQPALVGYGNGQLEMVAVGQNGTLFHWRYQNGSWTSATQLSGTVLSQPILVHLGAGQLATLAVGTDKRLYLWYFSNGAWASPRQMTTSFLINPVLFGPMAASSWGECSIDLALVEAQTGVLYQGRLGAGPITNTSFNTGMTPGSTFTSLGGNVIDTPVMTALSPTRINILDVGTDHAVYSRWSTADNSKPFVAGQSPPIVWSGYDYLGVQNVLLGGVVKTGSDELTAVGIDSNGHVILSRYCGAGWMQYQPVTGQSSQTQLSPPRYRPAVSALNS